VQCDEIWSFVHAKEKNIPEELKKNGIGDVWTWVGIDADTKLVVSWLVGNRDADTAYTFMQDVAYRLKNRVQLTTDGLRAYIDAVEDSFTGMVDYAQLVKLYGKGEGVGDERRYSPVECTGAKKNPIMGTPDPAYISTSYCLDKLV
jgi:IS1 family transposase